MTRRALAVLGLAALGACARDTAGPSHLPGSGDPQFVISDGSRPGGNPDFFFLPPMVSNPSNDPDFTEDGFNPNLGPAITVTVCALDVANNAPESAVTATTACKSGGYAENFSGSAVEMILNQELYKAEWKIPASPETYYRIFVRVGETLLGFADVKTANSGSSTDFVVEKDGKTLPIKFRIESGALCSPAGSSPCSSNVIDPDVGGTVLFVDDGEVKGGVTIPPQPGGGDPIVVNMQNCAAGNIAVDIPRFGGCITVTTDPEFTEEEENALEVPGSVFVCQLDESTTGLSEEQEELLTLHRQHNGNVFALPHTGDSCPVVVGARGTLGGFLRALVHGNWHQVKGELAAMIGPTPLLARRLDAGAGGITEFFSDFQFALPAKMEITETSGGQGESVQPGAQVTISALVTDLNGDPVQNAWVHFNTSSTSVTPAADSTDANGIATATWTVPNGGGSAQATASGFGIATEESEGCEICIETTSETEGPRSIFDPFMAIQPQFNPASDPVPDPLEPVELGTGTLFYNVFVCLECGPISNVTGTFGVKRFDRYFMPVKAMLPARKKN